MKFSVQRETLLRPLTIVAGAVERRQTMPILSNMLFKLDGKALTVTGTDLEVELSALIEVENSNKSSGAITVPARKIVDICKSLPEEAEITFSVDDIKAVVQAGRSRFSLATLPANDFPSVQRDDSSYSATVEQKPFGELIQKTAFSMAQQDVRYYLNGMLWELTEGGLRAVATDGHRLAIADIELKKSTATEEKRLIIPRKGILELTKLLSDDNSATIDLEFGSNHIRAATDNLIFVSKLVDGKFPDYQRVLPKNGDKVALADRLELKAALSRAAILSNEKFRGVRFTLENNLVGIQANNPEQEEASEEVLVEYRGDSLEMGFNVSYLIDVLGVLTGDNIKITFSDPNSSALIHDGNPENNATYVIMPMRL